MIESVNIWPSLIYKTHCPLDLSKVVDMCMDKFTDQAVHTLEKGNGKTTFNTANNLLFEPECSELQTWLSMQSQKVWNLWEFADIPRYVHRSWVNIHPPGAWTDDHDHGQVHQTIVIYLKQPENGGNIMFKDPMQYTFANFPKIGRNDWKVVEVKQNDVLFFPGFLHHMTEVNQSDEDRLVMTVTVAVDIFHKI